jgi:hypothetical protein
MRRAKWGEKGLPGGPWGYATDASEAFRTVSPRTPVNKGKKKGRDVVAPAHLSYLRLRLLSARREDRCRR